MSQTKLLVKKAILLLLSPVEIKANKVKLSQLNLRNRAFS